MSKCFGCYFHRYGYLYNSCSYFDAECYIEPNECIAFSNNGKLEPEIEARIFDETNGNFGAKGNKSD